MNLHTIDWTIVIVAVVLLRAISASTRKYMRGVADFLAANRSAKRYLLTIADQMGGIGVVTFVADFEAFFRAGATPFWWAVANTASLGFLIPLSGWIYYRFRESRALTMAQYFEMRYSRRFRVFAGIICWTSGLVNFGIFPAVAARFFVHFCGLPLHFHIPGIPIEFSTFAVVMAIDLGLALVFVLGGGQITVMITECAQGIFCALCFVVVTATVIVRIHWSNIVTALAQAPANASQINPFNTSQVKDFDLWYYVIVIVGSFFTYMSWQGGSGFFGAAATPHEQKMGKIIGYWRLIPQDLMKWVLPLGALAVLRLPQFSQMADVVNMKLQSIGSESVRDQMRVPLAMAQFLPIGVKGLVATMMLFISFTCHDTYLHSWGTIFVQDVVMPIRGRALSPEKHIRLLRFSIIGVAIFAFLFSLFYPIDKPIRMFFAITGTIWLGGCGPVIIGGLYWKRGTTAAAYVSLIIGAGIGFVRLFLDNIWRHFYGHEFPINGQWVWLICMVLSSVIYVIVSLLTSKVDFNLDRVLHRGKYAIASDHVSAGSTLRSRWQELVGISKEFSFSDKVLAIILIVWNMGWVLFFIVFSLINLFWHVSDAAWIRYWWVVIVLNLGVSVPIVVWFTLGGIRDMRALYRSLATAERDVNDDGMVRHEQPPRQ